MSCIACRNWEYWLMSKLGSRVSTYIRSCNWLHSAFLWIKRLSWNETEAVGLQKKDELWQVTGMLYRDICGVI